MRKLIVVLFFFVAVITTGGRAFAAPVATVSPSGTSITVSNDKLSLGAPSTSTITFHDIQLENWIMDPTQYDVMNPTTGFYVDVIDSRIAPSSAGWHLTMEASNFGAGLEYQNFTVTGITRAANVQALNFGDASEISVENAAGVINNGSAPAVLRILNTSAGSGVFRFTLLPENIVLDGNNGNPSTPGTYTSTITISLSEGP